MTRHRLIERLLRAALGQDDVDRRVAWTITRPEVPEPTFRSSPRENRRVISRSSGYLRILDSAVPPATQQLQSDGFAVLNGIFQPDEISELRRDLDRVFAGLPADVRNHRRPAGEFEPFRYEMINRSGVVRRAVGRREILDVIEPLLGEDCHIIACTAWRQSADENRHGGRFWHIDSGPHVPRPAGVPWDERIPYPVFAIAAHIFLIDCPIQAGPTGVIVASHTSGQAPPNDRVGDDGLTWNGIGVTPLVAKAGDVALFVSDVWHRRLPSADGDPGRFFQQVHYARRDIAQRIRPTSETNQLSADAVDDIPDVRSRTLFGLHPAGFYDG